MNFYVYLSKSKSILLNLITPFVFIHLFIVVSLANGATRVWDGGGGENADWTNSANWVGDVAPVSGDDLVFPNEATQLATNNDYPNNTVFNQIIINKVGYTINGNPLALLSGINVAPNLINGSVDINAPLLLNAPQSFRIGFSSVLNLSSIDNNGDILTLDVDSASQVFVGPITGSGDINITGNRGNVILTADNNYSGQTIVNGFQTFLWVHGVVRSSVNVESGFLLGTGTVLGNVSVSSIDQLQFGAASGGDGSDLFDRTGGTLRIQGNLTIESPESRVQAMIADNSHSQLNVSGTVNLNNCVFNVFEKIDGFSYYRPPTGTAYRIINNEGNLPINGTFKDLPEGADIYPILNENRLRYKITYRGGDGNDVEIKRVSTTDFDFDGDGKADVSVFRPSNGTWYIQQSTDGFKEVQFGTNADVPVPADYDGDGKTDLAFFRPANGFWYVLRSSDGAVHNFQWGMQGDIPVPFDYDGDFKLDPAVFRDGAWWILRSSDNSVMVYNFGTRGDKPLPGYFHGEYKSDLVVFRPSVGNWYIQNPAFPEFFRTVNWGLGTDIPISGSFYKTGGEVFSDFVVFRNGIWYTLTNFASTWTPINFGLSGDIPVPADYDDDGFQDIAVFRNGLWAVRKSSDASIFYLQFGLGDDIPLPKTKYQKN